MANFSKVASQKFPYFFIPGPLEITSDYGKGHNSWAIFIERR